MDDTPTKGTADALLDPAGRPLDPSIVKKIAMLRGQVRESFGGIVMAMMSMSRYCHLTIEELKTIILDPLVQDRIAIAYPSTQERAAVADYTGFAIWASVSEEVDAKIREQSSAGTFPVRLKTDDWTSGDINWLLDVLAPNAEAAALVLANFKQVVDGGELRIHPVVAQQVDEDTMRNLGAQKMG